MEWSFGAVVSFRKTKYLSLYSGDIIKYNIIFYRILTPSWFPFTLSNIIIKLVKCMKSSNRSLEKWILLIWCYSILGTTGEKIRHYLLYLDPDLCPWYGCSLLPRDIGFDEEAKGALTNTRRLFWARGKTACARSDRSVTWTALHSHW